MSIHARYGGIKDMDISLLSTTNDIEQLRTLALAMVQKVVSENAEREKLQQRIRLLEEALMLARQLRFGRKSEVLSGLQRQLFEEDVDTDIAATEVRLRKLLQPDDAGEKKVHIPTGTQTPSGQPAADHQNHRTRVNGKLPGP